MNKKRMMSVLLTAVMLLALLPVLSMTAFAAVYTNGQTVNYSALQLNDLVYQGATIYNDTQNTVTIYKSAGNDHKTLNPGDSWAPSAHSYYTVEAGETESRLLEVTLVTSITVKASTNIVVGSTETLTPTIQPGNASVKTVTWTSDNTDVATVDADGVVTAVAVGTANITATSNGAANRSAVCAVTVDPLPVSTITVTPATKDMVVGDTATLSAQVSPTDATDPTYTWSVATGDAVTVDQNGVVTAVAVGPATVRATANDASGKYGECAVTVTDPTTITLQSVSNTAGDAHVWRKDSGKDVAVTFKDTVGTDKSWTGFLDAGRAVKFDGALLTENTDYTAAEGSTVITLKASVLQNASIGSHTLTASFQTGSGVQDVSAVITVKTPASASPDTADHRDQGLWYAILGLSVVGVASMVTLEKKRRVSGK